MEKVLPVCEPIITSYPWIADSFSVLESDANSLDWLFSNYIQLYCEYEHVQNSDIEKRIFLNFLPGITDCFVRCPLFYNQVIHYNTVRNIGISIVEFVKNCIDDGNYVYGLMNASRYTKDLPPKYFHPIFIFGYDMVKETFHVADFLFNSYGKYTTCEIPMESLRLAFEDIALDDKFLCDKDIEYNIFRLDHREIYKFNRVLVINQLSNYLSGTNSIEIYRMRSEIEANPTRVYGIKVYDLIEENIKKTSEKMYIDVRALHVLMDHKVLMQKRLSYFGEKGYANFDNYLRLSKEIADSAIILRALSTKYIVSRRADSNIIRRILSILNKIKQEELILYQKLIDEL